LQQGSEGQPKLSLIAQEVVQVANGAQFDQQH
jgi:hypothetical protein